MISFDCRRMLGGVVASCIFTVSATHADECHPELDAEESHYIVGYGSLMERESKRATEPNAGINLPVLLKGFQRSWNIHGVYPTTYLGVQPASSGIMVAALYRDFLDADGKLASDAREIDYCRAPVDPALLTMLDGSTVPASSQIWIYANKQESTALPDAGHPIVQSYVDIFITGCLQLQERVRDPDFDFVEQSIRTTDGWSKHWVNDRISPRRPFHYQPKAFQIDSYLNRLLPEYVSTIEIE